MQHPHLLLFGTSGRTGQHLLSQALDAGYKVTAVVRNPKKITTEHPQLTVLEGDISHSESIDRVFQLQDDNHTMFDAVLSTLGIFQREEGTPLADGTRRILDNMTQYGVNRIVVMSSMGVGDSHGQGSWLVKLLVKTRLSFVIKDKNKQEAMIANSGLNWTVIRPAQIIPGNKTEHYYLWSGQHENKKIRWQISQGDAAHAMLNTLNDNSSAGKAYQISYLK